ncbi:MAG TPA: ThuA domain-containing protein [Tepidisphaeraceae bacterium]|nr:ThuA domain-containing protein [Tepidisphaeraceae bacterium]
MPVRVTVWNEFVHEKKNPAVAEIYPEGIHETIAQALNRAGNIAARCAWLDQPEHGLTDEVLADTDVLIWWGHTAHHRVEDRIVERVHGRVLAGMGIIVLHSGHHAKIFKKLMGTSCNLKWREADDREILWITKPNHPILAGIDDHFVLPSEEMYGEYFDVPEPLETILISNFTGGEVFRSGLTYTRGAGRIFYFRPGHETYPTFHDANVQRIIQNACHWAAPVAGGTVPVGCPNPKKGWV